LSAPRSALGVSSQEAPRAGWQSPLRRWAGPLQRDLWWALAVLALLLLWDTSGWDLAAARWYGTAAGFAWRSDFWLRTVLHDGGRWLAGVVLLLQLFDAWRPIVAGPTRGERLWALAVVLATLLAVPLLKQTSSTSCPWALAEFGGVAAYVPHWRWGVGDGGPGHCFPSGHASAAFAFLAPYFALRRTRARLARRWLLGVLVAGALFGWAQWARGAHYPSHTLWTAWLAWTIAALAGRRLPGR
jgi:membrane-associated PAP2 superfamily phosphatase